MGGFNCTRWRLHVQVKCAPSTSDLAIYHSPRRRIRSQKEIACEMDSQSYSYELDGLAITPQPLGIFKMRPAGRIIDLGSLWEVANKEN